MRIASTKSPDRRKKRQSDDVARATKPADISVSEGAANGEISERAWLIAAISIMVVGACLRLYDLQLAPLHHDEGVNGNFLVRLVRDGFYHYDPENYHGPTLYYFAGIIPWILRFLFGPSARDTYGLTAFNIRLVPALFGLATIWLVLLLRRRLGTIGALSAAALLAISPGAVYVSRYFIHEALFVFFTLAILVAGLRYYENAHPVYLILAAVSTALLFCTKETFIITAPVLLMALAFTRAYLWLRRVSSASRRAKRRSGNQEAGLSERMRRNIDRLGGPRHVAMWSLTAVAWFVAVSVLFYSSFFTNWPKGVYDSLRTFQVWTRTGQTAHKHEWWTYLGWLAGQESPLLVLGGLGAVIAVWRPKNTFALFSALWAFGMLAVYSYVPYKTPWLALNFIIPLALVGGYAISAVYQYAGGKLRLPVAVVVLVVFTAAGYQMASSISTISTRRRVLAALVPGYQTVDLNFFNYDNNDAYYLYVYAHTKRETLKLVDEINQIAQRSGLGQKTGIAIVAPEYWPLPWYLRDYKGAAYHGRMVASNDPIIIAAETQRAEVETILGSRYQQINSGFNSAGSFPMRPGVDLLLYVRRDLPTR